jgi:copper chaperone CopZ
MTHLLRQIVPMTLAALSASLMTIVASADPTQYNVKIEGMTCESCVNSVTKALAKLPGVTKDSVKVVLKEKKATLTVSEDKKELSEQIKKAIEGAGYTVTDLTVAQTAPSASMKN